MNKINYYQVLQVSASATKSEIKSSYRKLARRYHPDKNKSPEASQLFTKITKAYQTLADDLKRREHDMLLRKTTDFFKRKTQSRSERSSVSTYTNARSNKINVDDSSHRLHLVFIAAVYVVLMIVMSVIAI